jgi:hypothetical protein
MNRLAVLGASGYGKMVHDAALSLGVAAIEEAQDA